MKNYTLVLKSIIFTFMLTTGLSQDNFPRNEMITILEDHTVYRIDEDRNGNLWIATDKGLYKYDGNTLNTFENSEFKSGEIIYVKCDTINDKVWIKDLNHKIGYVCDDTLYSLNYVELNKTPKLVDILPIPSKKIYFGNNTYTTLDFIVLNFHEGNCQIDTNNIKYIRNNFFKLNSINNPILFKYINDKIFLEINQDFYSIEKDTAQKTNNLNLLQDSEINYWKDHFYLIHSDLKVSQIDEELNIIKEFKIPSNSNIVRAISDHQYLGLCKRSLGFELFDLESKTLYTIDELNQVSVNDFFQDSRGILWIGTENKGLKKIILINNTSVPNDVHDNLIVNTSNICSFRDSLLFHFSSSALYRVSNDNKHKSIFQCDELIKDIKPLGKNHLALIGRSTFYIITIEGELVSKKNLCAKDITYFNSKILVATCQGIRICNSFRLNDSNKLFDCNWNRKNYISSNKHKIYFASKDSIYNLNIENKTKHVDSAWHNPSGITDIELDENNILWVSTISDGLLFKDINIDDTYQEIKNIPKLNINKLKIIDQLLFIFTPTQLYSLNIETKEISLINELLKVKDFQFTDVSKLKEHFYFSSEKGILKLPKLNLNQKDKNNPLISINHILYNDSIYSNNKNIDLEYDYSNLKINFSTQDFYNFRPIKYYYKIFLDDNLIRNESISEHNLNLSNLRPGKYQLQVSRSNTHFDEKSYIHLDINVTHPYYQEWWFIISSSLLLIFISISAYSIGLSYLTKNKVEREKIKKELDHLKLTTLQEKLNPHFINNILNTSQYYISFESQDKASNLISKLSTLMRSTFDQMKMNSVSLSKELKFISDYTKLQNEITKTDINFSIDTGEFSLKELDRTKIPVYVIQPVIENAMKHNLNSKKLNIELSLAKRGRIMYIAIKDDGKGIEIDKLNELNSSLEIIAKRLTIINGTPDENITFKNSDKFFIVTLKVKLNSSYL